MNNKKVLIQELMQIVVKKYNIDDITFSKKAIEKCMRDIFHDNKSPYNSYIETVPTKNNKTSYFYYIEVTDETIQLMTNLIVLYNMAGPVILKNLILKNKFKKHIFDERINKIANDMRQLELLAVNQDVLYKLLEECNRQKDSNGISSDKNNILFADFIKSIDIIHELSSSKISHSKGLIYNDIQLLLYPNKINIENDKDKLIRDIEISLHNNQFSISEEIIDEAVTKYPEEIIFYYLKFKIYYKAERLAARNFNMEYLTEDNRLDHPELLDIFRDDAVSYRNKIIDILLKILELWPEDKRKFKQRQYKQIEYNEILYYLIKYRNMLPAEYKVINDDKEVDTSCYTEQFFKDSYELYKKECDLYDNGNISYSYEVFKNNFLNGCKNKESYFFMQNPYLRFPCVGYKYEESKRDKEILSYIKIEDLIYNISMNITKEEILEFFRKTSPEKYYAYLQQWKESFQRIHICNNSKPSEFYFIEKLLSSYHEYSGEFLYNGKEYLRDAFEPEELKSLFDNLKAKYIEYIEELFSVSYTRFYIEQQCAHADDDFIDDDDY